MAILTKGIELYEATYSESAPSFGTALPNLVSIGDLGNDGLDTVEVTTLASSQHEYIGGLATIPGSIEFNFLFDAGNTNSAWDTLSTLDNQTKYSWQVKIPKTEGSSVTYVTCTFAGYPAVKFNGATYNEASQFTLSIVPSGTFNFS